MSVAVVTGGSAGLGRAIVRALEAIGATVLDLAAVATAFLDAIDERPGIG